MFAIGHSWNAPYGIKKIEKFEDGYYYVREGDERMWSLLTENDVAKAMEIDAANIAYSAKCRQEQAEREAKEAAAIKPLTDYLETLTPLRAGKERVSLERVFRWPTGHCEARWKAILRLLSNGYKVEGERLMAPDESYFDQKAITSYGIKFAIFIRGIDLS